jgi:hypothetical protein
MFNLLVLCITLILSVNATYNPFEPDVIKLTNTIVANVNLVTQAQFINFDTTAVFNTDSLGRVFTSITSNGVVAVAGTYMVDIVLYYEEPNENVNVGVEVTVDGVSTGIIGANGYIKNDKDHVECSTSISDLVKLSTTSKIGFMTEQIGRSDSDVVAPAGESSITITRVDDI